MHWTATLQRNSHPMTTQFQEFRELTKMHGSNIIDNKKERARPLRRCITEMQLLFACLKKWDFEDGHCKEFTAAFDRCCNENLAHMEAQRKRFRAGQTDQKLHIASEGSSLHQYGDRLTVSEANRLFAKYPQPNIGPPPNKFKRRMGHMSYADDHFGDRARGYRPN